MLRRSLLHWALSMIISQLRDHYQASSEETLPQEAEMTCEVRNNYILFSPSNWIPMVEAFRYISKPLEGGGRCSVLYGLSRLAIYRERAPSTRRPARRRQPGGAEEEEEQREYRVTKKCLCARARCRRRRVSGARDHLVAREGYVYALPYLAF
ncbi:hypothetical protein AVEN_260171-1 [Araneus ventricosus]|uniref:Uncharacterized protein n=1 Tax=Araneus ventricosus TaxID=182803 RepID=A0A4Y2DM19_ARAVE|nr:hypothetical protein AVEN_260171-1 [Araneus ventricosus]